MGAAELRTEVAVGVAASCQDRVHDTLRHHRLVVARIRVEVGEEGALKADRSLQLGCYT